MSGRTVAAVDLGASGGRVAIGRVGRNELVVTEVHRFQNGPAQQADGLHWDVRALFREILTGLRAAVGSGGDLESVAVDAWGVDYGLLDEAGALVEDPFHYRDDRTLSAIDEVHRKVRPEELYARTGIQFQRFNTVYQLAAARAGAALEAARTMLMIPELIGYWLSGTARAEVTNASTTGLLDVRSREWDEELISAFEIPRRLFLPLGSPGDIVGPVLDEVGRELGVPPPVLTLVGSHDTASALVGIPAQEGAFAYISCGTWGLVGVELDRPILTEASRASNFTNEAGVDGRIRYHRNVMGLWLLQESMRTWELEGLAPDLASLLAEAGGLGSGGPVIDANDGSFLPPGDMPARIAAWSQGHGTAPPVSRAAVVRCILDSLAVAFALAVRDAVRLSGRSVDVIHLVGGGARNELLCRLTADACELPVLAGPVEATAIGNVLVQARSIGLLAGDLDVLRDLVYRTQEVRRYEPAAARSRSR